MTMTTPSIFEAQNTRDARRHVAAQARTYSDAKRVLSWRVAGVFVLALALACAVCAVKFPNVRSVVGGAGGVGVLLFSFAAGNLEKVLRYRAAAIQEEFDTNVFQMRWNSFQADRPNAHDVNRAADRYRGDRDSNWYDPTRGTHRPYDVLICQSSNLGWGASMHFRSAWMLIGVLVFLLAAVSGAQMLLKLPASDFLLALVVPLSGPFKEVIEQIAGNLETSRAKESAERKISDFWRQGMSGGDAPTEQNLREIQDNILQFRQSNPYIPDWLDSLFHEKNESAMRTSVEARVEEARRCGRSADRDVGKEP